MAGKTCPRCGYEKNSKSTLMCGLCGGVFEAEAAFAAEELNSEILSRKGEDKSLADVQRRDFNSEIKSNQNKSLMMMAGFVILIAAMGWAVGNFYGGYSTFGIVAALAIATIYAASAWFAGDKMILGVSHARKADEGRDIKLLNVVEEMAIASGLPMPNVYVIESRAMNAFATGRSPETATIAVTRGLLDQLNREELQAVVAHELGHVRNFDIRYAMLTAAMVGAIVLLADSMRHWWWFGSGRGRKSGGSGGGGAQIAIMVVSILLIILAPVFARMLQMAISRKREFLADASAVEFTRNPAALTSALESINKSAMTVKLDGANRAIQHLYIINPLKAVTMKSGAMFSTHPPIEARIRVLRSMS